MSIYKYILVFLVVFVSLDYVQPTNVHQDHPFDLLIFTQQWPQTLCKEWKQKDSTHTCTFPSNPDSWTIHGVWPTKLHTIGPAFCNRSWHFDPEAVRPIEAPLKELWTNIENEPNPYGFWTHEWSKHGTCAAVLEPLNSEFKYFSNGLNWMKKYSMTNILSSNNIIPSNDKEYPIAEIHKAVTDTLHVNPAIECRKIEGKSWLVEIRICFNKTLHLTDCDGIVGFKHKQAPGFRRLTDILTNCDVSEHIRYTKSLEEDEPPRRWIVQLYRTIVWLQWLTM
ncbi:hypothetical protein O0L34_g11537 [Tuta absoluta]|nr:hypothetical protein O0L34_g11537 [Tuta absoluta]